MLIIKSFYRESHQASFEHDHQKQIQGLSSLKDQSLVPFGPSVFGPLRATLIAFIGLEKTSETAEAS